MLSEKKKRSDLGLHIFLPKSKCSLKKKKKGLHSESSSEQTSAANPKLYMLFSRGALKIEGGPPKKGGPEATASFASPNIHHWSSLKLSLNLLYLLYTDVFAALYLKDIQIAD